jgi:predicted transcriptional regulator of viral defense system
LTGNDSNKEGVKMDSKELFKEIKQQNCPVVSLYEIKQYIKENKENVREVLNEWIEKGWIIKLKNGIVKINLNADV